MTQALAQLSERAGVPLDATQVQRFERYLALILEVSQVQNLTALETPQEIVDELFLDALAAVPLLAEVAGPALDVGTGAGVPGLPLAIMEPERRFVLMDSNSKKMDFVQRVAADLGLACVQVRGARVEEAGHEADLREQFGVVMAKGVAALRILVEWLVPLVRLEGRVICWKGASVRAELEQAQRVLAELGAEVERLVPYQVPHSEERYLVVIRRKSPLDGRYPRRVGVAQKRPL